MTAEKDTLLTYGSEEFELQVTISVESFPTGLAGVLMVRDETTGRTRPRAL